MPRGQTPERVVVCRACGQPFRSTAPNVVYCRRPECNSGRCARGLPTPSEQPGRIAVQRAVVRLAHARGLRETRAALRALAAEALAWERALPARVPSNDCPTHADLEDAA